jgi:hypothetical protein
MANLRYVVSVFEVEKLLMNGQTADHLSLDIVKCLKEALQKKWDKIDVEVEKIFTFGKEVDTVDEYKAALKSSTGVLASEGATS